MYRILIVDDEPAIVNGLAKMFRENERLEMDIYKAYSGFEAVEVMKSNRIDIVLSDIRMPGMTGLQLRDQIIFYWPSCKFIFLTGYNEFEYVYEAIHKPAENYLLKTESDDVVIAAVEEAIKKIKQEKEQWDIINTAQKQLKEALPLLRKELFESILLGESSNAGYLSKRFDELGIVLDVEMPILTVVGRVDCTSRNLTHTERVSTFYSIQKLLEKSMEPYILTEGNLFEQSKIVWFLQPHEGYDRFKSGSCEISWGEFTTYIRGELEKIQDSCRELFDVSITFIIARKAVDCSMLYKEFDLIRSVASKSLANSSQMIIDLGRPNEYLCMLRAQKLEKEDSFIVTRLNQYICENPGGDLSLTRLAEIVHFNPSYLSRFYKQVTGRNLSDYINEVKLTASKKMLENPDLKVNEIAVKLGFDSPSYFTAFFKKMTGMTPQDHRNLSIM